jgi:hypothetical protein
MIVDSGRTVERLPAIWKTLIIGGNIVVGSPRTGMPGRKLHYSASWTVKVPQSFREVLFFVPN